jgi:hypothetical protein
LEYGVLALAVYWGTATMTRIAWRTWVLAYGFMLMMSELSMLLTLSYMADGSATGEYAEVLALFRPVFEQLQPLSRHLPLMRYISCTLLLLLVLFVQRTEPTTEQRLLRLVQIDEAQNAQLKALQLQDLAIADDPQLLKHFFDHHQKRQRIARAVLSDSTVIAARQNAEKQMRGREAVSKGKEVNAKGGHEKQAHAAESDIMIEQERDDRGSSLLETTEGRMATEPTPRLRKRNKDGKAVLMEVDVDEEHADSK